MVGVVQLICFEHILVKDHGVCGYVIHDADIAGRVVHLSVDRKVRVGFLIPVILAQVQMRDVVEVVDITAVSERGHVVSTDHRRVVIGFAGHVVAVDSGISVAASVRRIEADDILVQDIDVVFVLDVHIAAVNGRFDRSSAFAVRLEIVAGKVSADQNVEIPGDIADFLRRGKIRRILFHDGLGNVRYGAARLIRIGVSAACRKQRAEHKAYEQ